MSEQPAGDAFAEQVRVTRRFLIWQRIGFVSWIVGIVSSLAIVVVEAIRSGHPFQRGPVPDPWLIAAIIPLVFVPLVLTLYWVWILRRYLQLMKVTGRAVTPAEAGVGEWRAFTFLEWFTATKWWHLIVAGIFTVIIGYKLLRLFIG